MKFLLLLLAVVLAGCSEEREPRVLIRGFPEGRLVVQGPAGSRTIDVEIAESERQRATGLMGVKKLDPDSGMVFIFPEMHDGPFYMKDTLLPLDIAFWDEQGKVVDVLVMQPCRADPCPLYRPSAAYIGALEMEAGSMADLGIAKGSVVTLRRTPD